MRIEINIPEQLAAELNKLAEKDNRSRKNYIEVVLAAHVQEKKAVKKS